MKFQCALIVLALIAFCGCDSSPKRIPVTGSITVNGKPAEGAILMFHTADAKETPASAEAEADGSFKIISGGEAGLVQGKYQVTVIWPDPSKKPTQAQIMMGTFESGPDLLKGKYSSKTTTKLSVDITSATTKLPPFEL